MTQKNNQTNDSAKEKINELYEKFDSLSDESAKVFLNFVNLLVEKTISLENKDKVGQSTFKKNNDFFDDSEEKTIPYQITFFVRHGTAEERLNQTRKLEMILHDALFKLEALFWFISLAGNVSVGGHHRLNSEQMMNLIDELGQIGLSIVHSAIDPLERLVMIAEKLGGQENE